MVQRDYVKRKKQPKKNKSRFMLHFMLVISVILIILFSAILYLVATNNENHKPNEKKKVSTKPPAITLPEQPQERWTYLKELESPDYHSGISQSSIQKERQQILDSFTKYDASTPSYDRKASSPNNSQINENSTVTIKNKQFILQCGAFKNKGNADTLVAKLAMLGIQSNIQSGELYRVITEKYANRNEAEKMVSFLKNNNINNCLVSAK